MWKTVGAAASVVVVVVAVIVDGIGDVNESFAEKWTRSESRF